MFTRWFLVRVKPLILVELDVANGDDFTVLWDPYAIDVAALIADEVADMGSRSGLVSYSFLVCQNLVSDRVGSTAICIEICGIWLVH